MAHDVRRAVESGEYASASEVIQDALRLWRAHQVARAAEIDELRQAWREGIESGSATPLDFADIKAQGRAALAKDRDRS